MCADGTVVAATEGGAEPTQSAKMQLLSIRDHRRHARMGLNLLDFIDPLPTDMILGAWRGDVCH
jgi:hypothetical protein